MSIGGEEVEMRNGAIHGQRAAVKAAGTSRHAFTGNVNIDAPQRVEASGADAVYVSGRRVDN
ncbi:hypothetical protein [Halococcus hamelinensis]|uniref:Uncharacterized protein n=1 Tax=Halococcus hamelinensis 100A6 TaxID=1132509 RepID=M0M6Q5_9EURY|nr:hypothetical protein [Halococcus hamelinensis]EMA41068.1 hypothetical protein C447_02687 [Halococcus hamelinensis 100A6]